MFPPPPPLSLLFLLQCTCTAWPVSLTPPTRLTGASRGRPSPSYSWISRPGKATGQRANSLRNSASKIQGKTHQICSFSHFVHVPSIPPSTSIFFIIIRFIRNLPKIGTPYWVKIKLYRKKTDENNEEKTRHAPPPPPPQLYTYHSTVPSLLHFSLESPSTRWTVI